MEEREKNVIYNKKNRALETCETTSNGILVMLVESLKQKKNCCRKKKQGNNDLANSENIEEHGKRAPQALIHSYHNQYAQNQRQNKSPCTAREASILYTGEQKFQ